VKSKIVDEVLYVDENNALTKFSIMAGSGGDPNLIGLLLLRKSKQPIMKAESDYTVFDILTLDKGSGTMPMNGQEI